MLTDPLSDREREICATLGPALRDEMLDLLQRIHAERGMTILFVTHQPEDARRIADRIVFLEEGRMGAEGSTAEFFSDAGPEAFRRYMGDEARSRRIARKPT